MAGRWHVLLAGTYASRVTELRGTSVCLTDAAVASRPAIPGARRHGCELRAAEQRADEQANELGRLRATEASIERSMAAARRAHAGPVRGAALRVSASGQWACGARELRVPGAVCHL